VVAISLRSVFSLEELPSDHHPINIILSLDRELLSLMADRAGDVVEFPEESLVSPPNPLDGPVARLIKGVHKMNGGLLHVLDPAAIFSHADGFETQTAHIRASQEIP
jgi:purine-binding chemotaxis protein CheW